MQPALSDYTRLLDTFLAGRSPRTLATCQADLEDYRRFMDARSVPAPTAGDAVRLLLGGSDGLASAYAWSYRSEMIKRGLPVTTINRRLATLRSLVKLANTHGLVTWTLSVQNVPVQPYRDTGGPGRDGLRAMLDAAGAQPGAKGLRDVALLCLLHDLGLRRSEAVRLDVKDVNLPGNWIFVPGKGRAPRELVSLPEPTRAALAAWLEARGPESGPLFVNFYRAGKGHRLTGAAVYHIVGWLGARPGSRSARTGCATSRSPPRSTGATAMCTRWRSSPATRKGPARPQPLPRQPTRPRRQSRSPCRGRVWSRRQTVY